MTGLLQQGDDGPFINVLTGNQGSNLLMTTMTYYIGIDGGGTRCRAQLEDSQGQILGRGESGPANIMQDISVACASILDACTQAIAASDSSIALAQVSVGAGLAGANIPAAADALQDWRHPFAALHVLSDLHAACLGAHEGEDGALIVCGTGSAATRFVNGRFSDTGGHGFLLGDMASGAWLGHKAVQHTLLCLDGLQPADAVSHAVCQHLGIDSDLALVQRVSGMTAAEYAALVPRLAALKASDDPIATAMFDEGAAYLTRVATHLQAESALPLCLSGGLAALYASELPGKVQASLTTAKRSPEQGAVLYAKRQQTLPPKR